MFRMNSAFGVLFLAGALGVAAVPASAQESYHGKFSLGVETYFGGKVLEPGDYSILVQRVAGGAEVVVISGQGGRGSVIASSLALGPESDRGRLVLVNVDGRYALRQFDAGRIGRSFTFSIPKSLRNRAAGGGTPRETTVVTVN